MTSALPKLFFVEKFTFTLSAALDDDRFKETSGRTKFFGQKLLFNLFGQNEKPKPDFCSKRANLIKIDFITTFRNPDYYSTSI